MSHGLDLGPIARVELACRDLNRQRDFYARILGLPPQRGNEARFRIGQLELMLRPRRKRSSVLQRMPDGP